ADLLPGRLPVQLDASGRGVPGELRAVRRVGDRQVERGPRLDPGRDGRDLGERAAVVPVVDARGRDGRLERSGRVPQVVGAAAHDVAVVAPALADLAAQVRQLAGGAHPHEQL